MKKDLKHQNYSLSQGDMKDDPHYLNGYEAYLDQEGFNTCTYKKLSVKWKWWRQGWLDAHAHFDDLMKKL